MILIPERINISDAQRILKQKYPSRFAVEVANILVHLYALECDSIEGEYEPDDEMKRWCLECAYDAIDRFMHTPPERR